MIISASGGKKEYAPCPEYTGKAVCVDVTPLKEYETEYGTKKKFKFAFEIDLIDDTRDPVQPWVVFTKPMVPSGEQGARPREPHRQVLQHRDRSRGVDGRHQDVRQHQAHHAAEER